MKQPEQAPLRPAATVLVVRERAGIEVLMVQRSDRGMFANALVFPGGMLEADDQCESWIPHLDNHEPLDALDRALRIAALREAWEETGLSLCNSGHALGPPPRSCSPDRYGTEIRTRGDRIDLSQIVPFSNWVTPVGPPKRYDTYFYLARTGEGDDAICDGTETVGLQWISPAELLDKHEHEEVDLLLATKGNLELLAQSETAEHAFAAASKRTISATLPERRKVDGVDCVTVPEGTEFGTLAIPTERVFRRRTSLS